jgi:hypothetical protein
LSAYNSKYNVINLRKFLLYKIIWWIEKRQLLLYALMVSTPDKAPDVPMERLN